MNINIFGALYTSRIQYEYTQTQYKEGVKYVNVMFWIRTSDKL